MIEQTHGLPHRTQKRRRRNTGPTRPPALALGRGRTLAGDRMTDAERREATALIDFWFGAPNSGERFEQRDVWFKADPDFDAELGRRFLALQKRAASGGCADWTREAEPCLALV